MYRCVTLYCIQQGIIKDGTFLKEEVVKTLANIQLSFQFNPKTKSNDSFLNNKNVEKEIRTLEVAASASSISTIREVRLQMVMLQRKMGENKSVVMDGRDIGTAVFPNAELKLFMTADTDIRIQRRLEELKLKGEKISFEEVKRNLLDRDYQDTHRKESPLIQATDAIVLDNSEMDKEEQLSFALQLANERIQKYKEEKINP
jgi:cytidylate kinase